MSKWSDFLHFPIFSNRTAIVLVMTTSLLAFAATPHTSVVQFAAAKSYPVGLNAIALATADLNGDGKLDLALSDGSGTLSVLFGNGDGTFQSAHTYETGEAFYQLTAADLNGDTKSDLIVYGTSSSGYQIGVLINNGDGTFGTVQFLSGTSGNASRPAVGDINGDQKTDILVPDPGAGGVIHVFLGKGDGTFELPIDTPLAGGIPGSSYLADFNGDGRPDLVITGNDFFGHVLRGGFTLWLGNGDGTFQLPLSVPSFVNFSAGLPEDLNQDGKADLVAFTGSAGTFLFLSQLGNGDGTFQSAISHGSTSGNLSLLTDLDGDMVPDVVAEGAGNIFIWLNHGDGTFQQSFSVPAVRLCNAMAAADLNDDGANDLIVATGQNTVFVLLNANTQFSLSKVTLSPSIITRGQTATGTLTVSLLNSFVHPISLSCFVVAWKNSPPPIPSCSVQPSSVTPPANGTATATLLINTSSSVASLSPGFNGFLLSLAIPCFGFLAFFRTGLAKPRLLLLTVVAGMALGTACGDGRSAPPRTSTWEVTIVGDTISSQQTTYAYITVQ